MTPLVLLVGFLGSGKTSLLRKTLPALKQRGIFSKVILNDYQNAKVDSASLAEMAEAIVPIAGSCVCCESSEELLNELLKVSEAEKQILFVEANGTTDSMQMIEMILFNPQVKSLYHPVLQVTVADCKRWQKRVWHNNLERLQAKTATHLVLGWQDTVGGGRVNHVRRELTELNPQAEFVDHEQLLGVLETSLNASVPAEHEHHHHEEGKECAHCDHDHDHEGHDHHHHHDHNEVAHGFVSIQFEPPADISREDLVAWWSGLPDNVLRAKGTLPLQGEPGLCYFQALAGGEKPHFETIEPNEWTRSLVVLIGYGITEDELQEHANRIQPASAN
ncbi:MAG: GTP-binding protein [Chthoniobacterales bacterium]